MSATNGSVVLIASDVFGRGDERLGGILMRSLIKTLSSAEDVPESLIFVNRGVFLTTEGSELLEDLSQLEAMGCEILNCGTCLDYFSLKDKLMAGKVSNMAEIVSRLTNADRIISP